jgi:hypothetical protein
VMMEAIRSFKTSVLTRATLRNIPEDSILHSHRRENLKSYADIGKSLRCLSVTANAGLVTVTLPR